MEVVLASVLGGLVLASILGLLHVRYVVRRLNLGLNRAKSDYRHGPQGVDQLRSMARAIDDSTFALRRVDGVLLALAMKPGGQGRLKSAWNALTQDPISMEFGVVEPALRSSLVEPPDAKP